MLEKRDNIFRMLKHSSWETKNEYSFITQLLHVTVQVLLQKHLGYPSQ